jgi:Uncharacterized conserved protein
MNLPEEGMLLRIFAGESDQYKGKALYEQIVIKARELNLAGATVIRGIRGSAPTAGCIPPSSFASPKTSP